ncbi:MAG: murein peptide amidase [Burkholderia sp.]|nr:murein peptide amidase [Burkholderia sp.]
MLCASALANSLSRNGNEPDGWCERLTTRLPGVSVADCQGSGLTPTGAASHNGFPILAREIPVAAKGKLQDPLRILLIGGMHGDELTSSSIVFQWLQLLLEAPARNFHWYVAPVVNPDGLLAKKPQRVNANGVDLNRNFPTPGWQHDAPHYWAKKTNSDPRRYPGRAPVSEPESKWLMGEMERFRPHVIVSVHAPYGVLDFDGPATPPKRFGRLWFNRVGVFPGSLGNYSGMHKNVPVVTIELANAQTMPSKEEVRRIWQDMLGWIENNVSTQTTAQAPDQPQAPFGLIERASATQAAPAAAKKTDTARKPAPKKPVVATKPAPQKSASQKPDSAKKPAAKKPDTTKA